MVNVVVVDDHAVVREGLKRIIGQSPYMTVSGEASGGNALDVVRSTPCDVLVLDISMGDKTGMDILKEIRAESPKLPVLILSMHAEDHQYAVQMLTAGAAGYLSKESAPVKLVEAIGKIFRGGKYVSPSLAERLALNRHKQNKNKHELLSKREHQVLCLIASGKRASEIAEHLNLSIKTVSTYRARILEKLDLANQAEMIRYAIKANLVE